MTSVTLTLFMLLAPHGGHVFGGQPIALSIQRTVQSPERWIVQWTLAYDQVVLQSGACALDEQSATLRVELPQVRAAVPIRWVCRTIDADDPRRVVGSVERTLVVHPPVHWTPPERWTRFGPVALVTDRPESTLAATLNGWGLTLDVRRDQNIDTLRPVDLLIVDQDALSERVSAAAYRIARQGGHVLVLAQGHDAAARTRSGPVRRAVMPARWRVQHPMLSGLDAGTLDGWLTERAMILPWPAATAEAWIIGGWPHADPRPAGLRDGVLTIEPIGPGVLVRCQLPVDDWRTDPRAQQLLRNMLLYLEPPTKIVAAN